MNGKDFIRRARTWADLNGQPVRLEKSRGKGGHQMLIVGGKTTMVKTSEIGPGLLSAMLRQLNIPKGEF